MTSDAAGPLLLLDVDGPLNPYAAKPSRRPAGYTTHRFLTPRWAAAEQERLSASGMPNKRPKPLRVWLNPTHGPALTALPFDLVWATTWQEEADAYLAPVLGLPALPHIAWPDPVPEPGGGVFWKTPAIVEYAAGRPFAWVDDDILDADRDWVAAHHPAPALLHRVDPAVGLTRDDFTTLADWAASTTSRTTSRTPRPPRPQKSADDRKLENASMVEDSETHGQVSDPGIAGAEVLIPARWRRGPVTGPRW